MCPSTCGKCDQCYDAPTYASVDGPDGTTDGIRFKFMKDGSFIWRSCNWVAARSQTSRCRLTSNSCRKTCGQCS